MQKLEEIIGWKFLEEPIYRWFIFMGALMGISIAWGGILEFMK